MFVVAIISENQKKAYISPILDSEVSALKWRDKYTKNELLYSNFSIVKIA